MSLTVSVTISSMLGSKLRLSLPEYCFSVKTVGLIRWACTYTRGELLPNTGMTLLVSFGEEVLPFSIKLEGRIPGTLGVI